MADSKISELAAATDLTGVELAGIQSGNNVRVPASLWVNLAEFSCVVANGASQLIATGGVPKKVTNLTQVDWDPSGFWSSVNQRMTPTREGLYSIDGKATIESLDDGARMVVFVYKNGVQYGLLGRGTAGATTRAGFGGALQIPMNGTTDYLELYVFHSNAVDTNIDGNPATEGRYTTFSATYLGPTP